MFAYSETDAARGHHQRDTELRLCGAAKERLIVSSVARLRQDPAITQAVASPRTRPPRHVQAPGLRARRDGGRLT
jgi:hypothetical protein